MLSTLFEIKMRTVFTVDRETRTYYTQCTVKLRSNFVLKITMSKGRLLLLATSSSVASSGTSIAYETEKQTI